MLIQNTVTVRIVNANLTYYRKKGYACNSGDSLSVSIDDLPSKSDIIYARKCDCCGKEYTRPHGKHIRTYSSFHKDVCPDCCKTDTTVQSLRKSHWEQTLQERYGVSNPMKNSAILERQQQTNLARYGVSNVLLSGDVQDKRKQTLLTRYGVENPCQNVDILHKMQATMLERYGHDNPGAVPEFRTKAQDTMQTLYGCGNAMLSPELKQKAIETNLVKYGVPYFCMDERCHSSHGISGPNQKFAELLTCNNISYTTEFVLDTYRYDFKIENLPLLIEVDPTPTHNVTWNPYGKTFSPEYHRDKTQLATSLDYRCVHVFDWDSPEKIVQLIQGLVNPDKLYGRDCVIQSVTIEDAKKFLNQYHLQGYARDQIRYGLYYQGELVSIMTWGTPRYSTSHDYELIRYASSKVVVGGAEKLFKHFLRMHNSTSIVSYCDLSKFTGVTYSRLGFIAGNSPKPSKHWYNMQTQKHITDNLLRQRGFDQLLGKEYGCYGKNTSNEELMLTHGFVEIYDCGQETFSYCPKN